MDKEILELTKQLVKIPSVNSTPGEKEIGLFIENYLRDIPYFKNQPELVVVQELKDDPLARRNVFALLMGEKERKADTIIFHGHTDTVGVDDFASLKDVAFHPDQLMNKLKEMDLPKEVADDLNSGNYLFGRGSCDMKSGDAVFMVLMKYLAENVKELSGNILVSFNPVEENLHTGIIEGCDQLIELREKFNLEYKLAINNDYICPMYQGDPHRYIYTGVVGKLLPCFYIQGRETHVGQCFEGFDATMVAANLVKKINLNCEFSDGYQGEYSLPPAVLKMKDLKTWYNVQTSKEALVYFNYFVHNAEMDEIIHKLVKAARESFEESKEEIEQKYKGFCKVSKQDYLPLENSFTVMTYDELVHKVERILGKEILGKKLTEMTYQLEQEGVDKREIPVSLIRELLGIARIYKPVIILYFAAPYCPHNTLQKEDEAIINRLKKITETIGKKENLEYKICHFFPSLSDSSYLKIDDSDNSIGLLKSNFPQMDHLYSIPIEKIKSLNIPAVNFGVYGKDAHKWTERVNISYSFGTLPKLILETIREFLG